MGSVLAQLMGIDRLSIYQSNHGKRRVLSDNYFQNIASIVHRSRSSLSLYEDNDSHVAIDIVDIAEGSSVNVRRVSSAGGRDIACTNLSGTNSEGIFSSEGRECNQFQGFSALAGATSRSLSGNLTNLNSSCPSANKKMESSRGRVQQANLHQSSSILLENKVDMDKYCPPNKPNGKSHLHMRLYPASTSLSVDMDLQKNKKRLLSPGRRVKNLYCGAGCLKHDFVSSRGIAKQVTSQVNRSLWHKYADVIRSRSQYDKGLSSEDEKKLPSLNENDNIYLVKNVLPNDSVVSSTQKPSSMPVNMNVEQVTDKETLKGGSSIEVHREQLSAEPLLENGDTDLQDFCPKDQKPRSPVSSLEGPEACWCPSDISTETNQNSSVSQCSDYNGHGLLAKLHLAEELSLESGSEGCDMMVSSYGDDESGSIDCYHEDLQIMELHGTLENRDFSYFVDVLGESGCLVPNFESVSKTWCSQGYALDPKLFDSLEKKYGHQTFWGRSERRLLFDRMNLELMDIAQSFNEISTWGKPLTKKMEFMRSQEIIEDELWDLLLDQEEAYKHESSDTVCRKEKEWLELEADTYEIVQMMESLLIDALLDEFVIMETSICSMPRSC